LRHSSNTNFLHQVCPEDVSHSEKLLAVAFGQDLVLQKEGERRQTYSCGMPAAWLALPKWIGDQIAADSRKVN
jgi:hypothetical protein